MVATASAPLELAALAYAAMQWPVAPLHSIRAGACSCVKGAACDRSPGKHPRTENGLDDATTDPGVVTAWWSRWSDANIAIRCDRLFVLDIDPRHGGDLYLRDLEVQHGELPTTKRVHTGGGGWHLYFSAPARKWRKQIGPGLDIQAGRGKYVLAPPSNHLSGRLYAVELDTDLAPAPAWLIEAATAPPTPPAPVGKTIDLDALLERRVRAYLDRVPPAVDGQGGHAHTFVVAQHIVRGFALDDGPAYNLLAEWNVKNQPPWSEADLRRKIREARAKGSRIEWGAHLEDARTPSRTTTPVKPPPHRDEDAPPHVARTLQLVRPDREPGEDDEEKPPTPAAVPGQCLTWISTTAIFAPLPPTNWLSRELGLCPGRPALIAAYGYSGKTIVTQAQALAVTSGREIWGHFPTGKPQRVRHFDYEQGQHATKKRYQRLALGMGMDPRELDGRLELCVFPDVYLNSPKAADVFARETDGCGLVLMDALRGATPGEDENDSKMRACLDMLSRVSEMNGTMFQLLHHAGKTKENHKDPRQMLRGSSGIFDACGCVLVITGERNEPRTLQQVKAPAEAEGSAMPDFLLHIEDVGIGENPRAGVRVTWSEVERVEPEAEVPGRAGRPKSTSFEDVRGHVLEVIRVNPGLMSVNAVKARCSLGSSSTRGQALSELLEEGRIELRPGQGGYRVRA